MQQHQANHMQSGHLDNFTFSYHNFILLPQQKMELPYFLGNLFRSALGMILRQSICATKQQKCTSCLLQSTCIYAYLYESPVPETAKIMRKYTSSPHPFIIGFDPQNRPEDKILFSLTLIGKSVEYLPYFVFATEELGKRGLLNKRIPYTLLMLTDGNQSPCYIPGKTPLATSVKKGTEIVKQSPREAKEVTLELITPLRIRQQNRILTAPTFQDIFRNLLRRIGLLIYFHCNQELEVDFRGLIDQSAEIITQASDFVWKPLTRYSSSQNNKMDMGGVTGRITFQGPITPFLPYLFLGETIHLGRNCSFGLGKYKLTNII